MEEEGRGRKKGRGDKRTEGDNAGWYGIVGFNIPLDTLYVISEIIKEKTVLKCNIFGLVGCTWGLPLRAIHFYKALFMSNMSICDSTPLP